MVASDTSAMSMRDRISSTVSSEIGFFIIDRLIVKVYFIVTAKLAILWHLGKCLTKNHNCRGKLAVFSY